MNKNIKNLSADAKELYNQFVIEYIESGYLYSGSLPTSCIDDVKPLQELLSQNLIQKRECEGDSYELTKEERKELILNHDLHSQWQQKGKVFDINNEYGEVFQVLGYLPANKRYIIKTESRTTFICQLPQEQQSEIKNELEKVLKDSEEIEVAMSGRVCDIEELF